MTHLCPDAFNQHLCSRFERRPGTGGGLVIPVMCLLGNMLCLLCFLPAGYRAAEEGREKMGQKVQVDEHEGGVRSPVLYSLAEPVCDTGPRQSRRLPVHSVKL